MICTSWFCSTARIGGSSTRGTTASSMAGWWSSSWRATPATYPSRRVDRGSRSGALGSRHRSRLARDPSRLQARARRPDVHERAALRRVAGRRRLERRRGDVPNRDRQALPGYGHVSNGGGRLGRWRLRRLRLRARLLAMPTDRQRSQLLGHPRLQEADPRHRLRPLQPRLRRRRPRLRVAGGANRSRDAALGII